MNDCLSPRVTTVKIVAHMISYMSVRIFNSSTYATFFSVRCNIYISRLCYDVRVRLSVTEVNWLIIANLRFKFRSKFTAHCGRSPQCSQCMRAHTASRSACGRIVVAVHAGKRGGVISRYASHC